MNREWQERMEVREYLRRMDANALALRVALVAETLRAVCDRCDESEDAMGILNTVAGFPFGESLDDVVARVDEWASNLRAVADGVDLPFPGAVSPR